MLAVQTGLPKQVFEQRDALRGGGADTEAEQNAAEALAAARRGCAAPGDRIPEAEIEAARENVSEAFRAALSLARVDLRRFHESRRRAQPAHGEETGLRAARLVRPLRRVGILCGGSFMSLLAHAVPAQVAGVGGIAAAVAAGRNGTIDPRLLATARSLGIDEVYRLSGAEAVAAMAFGAPPLLRRVDRVVGSDGAAADAAKRRLAPGAAAGGEGAQGELVVIADGSANARLVALDLLAQAEHGAGGLLMLLTNDRVLAEAVRIELRRLAEPLPNGEALLGALDRRGALCLLPHLDAAVEAANDLAPARLSLRTMDNARHLAGIETAGTVFLGAWAAETAGMNGCFATGPDVDAFTRETAVVEHGPERIARAGRHFARLAGEECRHARAAAIQERLELLQYAV